MQIAPRYAHIVRAATLKSAARAALDAAGARRGASLTIVVSGDAALRKLNRDYLGIDEPTDVLSFAADDAGIEPLGGPGRYARSTPAKASTPIYLGDVIISLMRAKAQAKSGGHSLVDELRLLVIHGVLHLLGHDHDTPARKKRMWAVQAKALKRVGASIEGPAEP